MKPPCKNIENKAKFPVTITHPLHWKYNFNLRPNFKPVQLPGRQRYHIHPCLAHSYLGSLVHSMCL
jgi:hypothetical protein